MTVRKLIQELKNYPPEMLVAFADFDMNAFEINAFISMVYLQDFSLNKNKPTNDTMHERREGKLVILR